MGVPPIDRYMWGCSLKIWEKIKDLKLVYLDLNFWLRLRDEAATVAGGKSSMLDLMSALVEKQKFLFPISDIIYYEVLKQHDESSREKTFEIIDKLSGGVALISDKNRIKLEFRYWVETLQNNEFPEPKKLVWGKLPLVVNYASFEAFDFSEGTEDMQNIVLDIMAEIPLNELTPAVYLRQHPFSFKDNVEEFNRNKKLYEEQNKTFDQLFLSEVGGMLDEASTLFDIVMYEKILTETGHSPVGGKDQSFGGKDFAGLIYQCFKKKKLGNHLPFFKICADIYSSFRRNKDRIYKDGNDTLDVMHAAGALPYFDYFFTERELSTIIDQRGLNKLYNCTVASKPDDVMNILMRYLN